MKGFIGVGFGGSSFRVYGWKRVPTPQLPPKPAKLRFKSRCVKEAEQEKCEATISFEAARAEWLEGFGFGCRLQTP